LTLDEGMYSDFTPVSYPPQVYTSHQPWGQNAHYSLVKEMGSPISLKPQLTYFTFTAICGIKVGGIEIHDMDNIGRVNVTIRNIYKWNRNTQWCWLSTSYDFFMRICNCSQSSKMRKRRD